MLQVQIPNLKNKITQKPGIHANFLSKWDFFNQFSAQFYVKLPN